MNTSRFIFSNMKSSIISSINIIDYINRSLHAALAVAREGEVDDVLVGDAYLDEDAAAHVAEVEDGGIHDVVCDVVDDGVEADGTSSSLCTPWASATMNVMHDSKRVFSNMKGSISSINIVDRIKTTRSLRATLVVADKGEVDDDVVDDVDLDSES